MMQNAGTLAKENAELRTREGLLRLRIAELEKKVEDMTSNEQLLEQLEKAAVDYVESESDRSLDAEGLVDLRRRVLERMGKRG